MAIDHEKAAVDRIISNLSGRKGLGDEWDCLDEDIQQEIRESMASIVREAIANDRQEAAKEMESEWSLALAHKPDCEEYPLIIESLVIIVREGIRR